MCKLRPARFVTRAAKSSGLEEVELDSVFALYLEGRKERGDNFGKRERDET